MADAPKPIATIESVGSITDGSIVIRQTVGGVVQNTNLPQDANKRFDMFYNLMQTFVQQYSDPTYYSMVNSDASEYHYQIDVYAVPSAP